MCVNTFLLRTACNHSPPRQPPFPEEDYPPGDYAEDPLADISEEYTLDHVTPASLPRAALDRSAPAGWALSVDPDGTWVFTSEHSQEQVGPLGVCARYYR